MNLFVVGEILKSRGLKGEVKVRVITDFPESFLERKSYYLGKTERDAHKVQVLAAKIHKGFAFLLLDGVDSVESADLLKGQFLFVDESQLMRVKGDFAYLHELIGLAVLDENEKLLGRLVDLQHMPSCDVYEIETADKQKVLIPAIDDFIVKVDVENKRVTVRRFEEFL
ncbi:16S rRNA processing protein RimM [Chloroherpeton thalassium ATCC 35110]|uniref:Ribosome maturation factor RimM n=1 Tax=Chloroherpeton thalassium (strain ATCC 35110 / GB-78) TaxID=517418 RepID=B3QXJ7_CHLT3|nr:ribosome maturation factor RimM [Chloroherpeton thalassium]ACF14912.1 16S rRNA processing protein RimM [Chloroherpeton thalassium ATCC 35110]